VVAARAIAASAGPASASGGTTNGSTRVKSFPLPPVEAGDG
jgi:hypothetical protein